MKTSKKVLGLVMIFGLLMVFSGCTSADGMRLSKALINQLNVKSAESTMELDVNVKLQGFEGDAETQKIIEMINASKLSINGKSDIANNKAYLKGSIDFSGIGMNGEIYQDGEKAWIKIPTEPKYIEINPQEFVEGAGKDESFKNAMKLQEKIQPLAIKFVKDYFSEYKYSFANIKNKGLATISTPEGQKEVTLIEVKLDNEELSKFVDYTVKNLAESGALREYMKSIMELAVEADPSALDGKTIEQLKAEMDKEFDTFKEEANKSTQELIDSMKRIIEVGSNGLTVTYGIDKDENIISSDMILDFAVKNDERDQKVSILLNCKSTMFNINKTTVDFPQFTEQNRVTLKDYVKNNETLKNSALGEAFGVKTKRIYLTVGDEGAMANGRFQILEAEPYIEGESTMVPVRFIGESLGAQVEWDEVENAAIYKENGNTIVLRINNRVAIVNGEEVEMPVAPVIKNGRTMVPLRFVSNELGAKVDWDDTTRTITIEK